MCCQRRDSLPSDQQTSMCDGGAHVAAQDAATRHPTNRRLRRRLARLLALASLTLAGCGGGIVIGLGGGFDDFPPDVSLVINVDQAFAGEVLRLSAAASDDYGVDTVEFYRIEPSGSRTFLGADGRAPWTLDTVMPDVITSSGSTFARYVARAVDGAGQIGDSTIVPVQQLR